MHAARRFWRVVETIHAVTYFAEESRTAATEAGLRGFWMGYFGFRAAPLGAVGPQVVAASFFNFAPDMVARSLPDAWSYASPDQLIDARAGAAAASLRRLGGGLIESSAAAVDELWRFGELADFGGRPLGAANSSIERPVDPIEALWQGCTNVREQRGDGHVAVLVAEGLVGLHAHVLLAASDGIPSEVLTDSRGWTDADWQGAHDELTQRGLFDADRRLTEAGTSLRNHIELRTDQLSWRSIERAIRDPDALARQLAPLADLIVDSATIRFPNPMGLPVGRPSSVLGEGS